MKGSNERRELREWVSTGRIESLANENYGGQKSDDGGDDNPETSIKILDAAERDRLSPPFVPLPPFSHDNVNVHHRF